MSLIDIATLYAVIFLPLIAAFFIALIPAGDTNSKITLSRFFAVIGLAAFIRLFFILLEKKTISQNILFLNFSNLDIKIATNITKQNIFLYGATAVSLVSNMYFYELNDTKSNIHQVIPFILTFVLYITLGQSDIRVGLPIISIASFIIYFLIGYGTKPRRGLTIFQMGTWIFSCDAIALILLQYQITAPKDSFSYSILNFILILPGLARLCLPMCAPFARRLFMNVDDNEGPFLVTFLQLAGFSILLLMRKEISTIPHQFSLVVGLVATISALYVVILAVGELHKKMIPYYFLIFYSAMSAACLFFSSDELYGYISIALLLTSISCFFHAIKATLFIEKYGAIQPYNQAKLRGNWFIAMCLFAGIPGFGIGASLWPAIFLFGKSQVLAAAEGYENTWTITGIVWGLSLILLSFALVRRINGISFPKSSPQSVPLETNPSFSSWIYVALLSWLIPVMTIIASSGLVDGSIFRHE